MSSDWFHLHAHSEFSALDGMTHTNEMVATALSFKQPAIAITDHGVMSGAVSLYKSARKAGIEPIIGLEAYIVDSVEKPKGREGEKRLHLTVLARNLEGYKTLVKLSSLSHNRDRYFRKPRLVIDDFVNAGTENLTVLTGCYFGVLQQSLVKDGQQRATDTLGRLARVFKNLYVEVQNHGVSHDGGFTDEDLADELLNLAKSVGVRPVVTQDSHYCMESHAHAHDMMKNLSIHSAGTAGFPGGPYHLCSTKWAEANFAWSPKAKELWKESEQSAREILEATEIRIPVLEKYAWHVPTVSVNPQDVVSGRCKRRMKALFQIGILSPNSLEEYTTRLDYELSIIEDTGFAGYFDLVSEYVDWCRSENILVNARGSANGSLVAWLLGITNVDPILWGLLVERFIDRSRTKPPDIDLDIEQTRRGEVVEYIKSRFNMEQIGTFLTMGMTEDDGGKGSLFINYLGYKRRQLSPDEFDRKFGKLSTGSLIDRIQAESATDLDSLRLLETLKVRRSAGAHPAGFILDGPNHHIADLVPTMLIPSSGSMVTQYQMDEVEDLGFIKIDLLGLRSLTVLRRCQELIGRSDPTDLSWIPNDDALACKELSKTGYESAIFQLEGWAISRGLRALKIKKTKDCITAVSLFRPALLDPGYDKEYLENRAQGKNRKPEYPHPIFKKHLEPTFGIPLYQEQVLEVLRDLGVSPDDLNSVLKAVKGKQGGLDAAQLFDSTLKRYEALAEAAGMSADETEQGWDLVLGFVGYGFNKSHATAYGLMAYRAGYLKAHYGLEYMTSALESVSGTDKEMSYVKETRKMGIKILKADVNVSSGLWTIDRNAKGIRRGLTSIKGVGVSVANAITTSAPYTDFQDFLARSGSKVTGKRALSTSGDWTGTLAVLKDAGAFESFGI